MINVKVYPDTNERHVLQIYTGLYDLRALGQVLLSFSRHFLNEIREFKPFTLWVEAEDLTTGKVRRICFDMVDGDLIASTNGLEKCDVYFKRSYSKSSLATLPAKLRRKVLPYGLFYSCLTRNETGTTKRILLEHLIRISSYKNSVIGYARHFRQSLKLIQSRCRLRLFGESLIPFSTDFEVSPSQSAQPKILFQARLWSKSDACATENDAERRAMNELRANVVRALRENFPKQFVGGLAPTDYAKREYPDCITNHSTNMQHYLNLVKNCLIAVTTTGLSGSTGAKLPEYLAASRCVVTQPLLYDLPVPLRQWEHYAPFQSPEECVKACNKLLKNPQLFSKIRRNNWEYYQSHVKPSSLIFSCLTRAFDVPKSM